jgi:hypothetical protein
MQGARFVALQGEAQVIPVGVSLPGVRELRYSIPCIRCRVEFEASSESPTLVCEWCKTPAPAAKSKP